MSYEDLKYDSYNLSYTAIISYMSGLLGRSDSDGLDQADAFVIKIAMQIPCLGPDVVANQ